MEGAVLAQVAAVAGAAGAALVLVPRHRVAVLGGLALLAAAEVALASSLLTLDDARQFVNSPARVAALSAGIGAVIGGAALFIRFPASVPVAVLVAAPFRVPLTVGGEDAFLLVPLYVVLAAAGLALCYRLLRGFEPELSYLLAVPVAIFIGLAGLSLLWSSDVRAGTIELVFFLFPFSALVAVVAHSPLTRWMPRALGTALVALAVVFSLVGFWQVWRRELLFAPDVETGNAYATFFRVTSLFKDPSLYGRHLALAIVIVLAALWLGRVRLVVGFAVVGLIWAGLFFSYSQSSMVALMAGVIVVTFLAAADSRRMIAVAGGVCAVAGIVVVLAGGYDTSLRRLTSGRSDLVANTATVIREHPLVGVGIGAEPNASREEAVKRGTLGKPSHTTPLTVAAELGIPGIAAYLLFLAAGVRLLLDARRRDRGLAVALAGVLTVLVVHSLFYSGFFQDPLTWGTFALAAAAASSVARPALRERPRWAARIPPRQPMPVRRERGSTPA